MFHIQFNEKQREQTNCTAVFKMSKCTAVTVRLLSLELSSENADILWVAWRKNFIKPQSEVKIQPSTKTALPLED